MAVDIKDVEQVAQELQQKFDDFKAKNDKRVDAIEQEKGKLAGQVETLNVLIHLKYEKNREDIGLFGI